MTIAGTYQGGVIVLDDASGLTEGTRVEVIVPVASASPAEDDDAPTLRGLLKHAGTVNELPADFAEQHDHYIHGAPRR
jgi:hypothetical protein